MTGHAPSHLGLLTGIGHESFRTGHLSQATNALLYHRLVVYDIISIQEKSRSMFRGQFEPWSFASI